MPSDPIKRPNCRGIAVAVAHDAVGEVVDDRCLW
jgi:hypothetical protein